MSAKLLSDQLLRSDVVAFLSECEHALCRSPEEAREAMDAMFSHKNTSRMVDGVILNVGHALQARADAIVDRMCVLVGSQAGDERAASAFLWERAVAYLKGEGPSRQAATQLLEEFGDEAAKPSRYILPSQLIALETGADRFEIGPIAIATGRSIVAGLNQQSADPEWIFEVAASNEKIGERHGVVALALATFNWDISVAAAKDNLGEEAAWLAGVLVSLLRLCCPGSLGPFVRSLGQVELAPFQFSTGDNKAITVSSSGLSTGGWAMPSTYRISEEAAAFCSDSKFQAIVENVFYPKKKSLGERVSQALGWLARGRQAVDRAERMLFFFTALEAMLSDDDNTAPVVQTIARNAASILTDDATGRAKNATLVKALYAARSSLIHAGTRGVTRRQANTVEKIAHEVCLRILDQCELAQPRASFQDKLKEASYGLAWYDPGKSLVPEPQA